jgi:hypothetical protein
MSKKLSVSRLAFPAVATPPGTILQVRAVGWGESSGERAEVLFGPGTQAMLWCTQSSAVAVPAVSKTDSAKQRIRGHDIVDGSRCTLWPPWWIDQAPKVYYVQR